MLKNNAAAIKSDAALASILSNFETRYIVNMVKESLEMRFRPYETNLPSLYSIEQNFVAVINNTDITAREEIMDVRQQTYEEIIDEVCKYYGFQFNNVYNDDVYSSAFWIYDFFVSNFTNNFFNFFINYIITNKDSIYTYMNIDGMKKKTNSTLYSKKIIEDEKLALIHANMNLVLENICAFDIQLSDIINFSYVDNNVKIFLINSLVDVNGNVFKEKFASLLNNRSTKTDIITNIKLRMQELLRINNQILNAI